MSVSRDGQKTLDLIRNGHDTEEDIERVTKRLPEDVARTLAALQNKGLVFRRYDRGEMRWKIRDD